MEPFPEQLRDVGKTLVQELETSLIRRNPFLKRKRGIS